MQVVKRSTLKEYSSPITEQQKREENTFIIGEDDDDKEGGEPVDSASGLGDESNATNSNSQTTASISQVEEVVEHSGPAKYWLQKGDTLHGIALRFKVDVSPFFPGTSS